MRGFSDKPLDANGKDLFDVSVYIDSLADFILTCSTPMTIAIQGDWGSGKTSMMQLIKSKLGVDKKDVFTIWFNTWQYSQFNLGDQLAMSFMSKMLKELGDNSGEVKKVISDLFTISKRLVSTAIKSSTAGIIDVEDAMGSSADFDYIDELIKLKDKFQEVINKKAETVTQKRIIVFIDDLDRLQPEKAVEMLEVMKVFLDCDNCVFILAVDYTVISQGLKKKFGDNISEKKGKSFFDKIIQLPFKMPVSLYNLESYLDTILKDFGINAEKEDIEKFKDLIVNSIGENPRGMKRLFNSFQLIKTVVTKNNTADNLTSYTQLVLFGILCMQMAYEDLYEYLLQARDDFDEEFFVINSKDDLVTRLYPKDEKNNENDIAGIFGFYKAFLNAIQLDNVENISNNEIRYLRDLLAFSAITSHGTIDGRAVKGNELRYQIRNTTKELIKILKMETSKQFKLYQGDNGNPASAYFYIKLKDTDCKFNIELDYNNDEFKADVSILSYKKSYYKKLESIGHELFGTEMNLDSSEQELNMVFIDRGGFGKFENNHTDHIEAAGRCYELIKNKMDLVISKID